MILLGTIINIVAILIGTAAGLLFTNIKERYKETIMQAIGLTVVIIGIQMALQTESIIIVLLSLLIGALIGELLRLDHLLNNFAEVIASKVTTKHRKVNVAQGFITASLIFGVGAMAILGSLDSGIRGDHGILYTKSILDGFTALVLTTTLRFGVVFSIVPIFLFQGTITLLATKINTIVPELMLNSVISQITAIGGILIIAIGLNILKIKEIRVTNLLPALVVVILFITIQQYLE